MAEDELKLQEEADDKLINAAFDKLINDYQNSRHRKKVDLITKAFNFARQAHKGVRRLSGEPYIMHPIAVAQIACAEACSPKIPPEIFVRPSTICAIFEPKMFSMSSTV